MRDFVSKTVVSLKPSGIRKFFDIASEIEGAISLGVGEPDFETPWHIRQEAIHTLEAGKTKYTANAGLKKFRETISKTVKTKYDVSYDPLKEILVTIGGSEAIDIALRAMIEPGDEVIICEPCYVSYEPCTILAGGKPVSLKLKEENDFRLTPSELESVITDKSKIIVMNFPNNPTGAIMSKEDFEKISKVIIEHDLIVISDEIYSELTYEGEHVSIASLPNMKDRTILINGFSKAYSMTGWRLGYACGPENVIRQMTKIHQFTIMCAPTTSQYAGIEALIHGDDDIKQMRDSYDERRKYVLARLRTMGISVFEPKGAFYVFPSIKKFGLSSEEFCLRLLNEKKLVVVPGNAFGTSGEGFVRISYAYSMNELHEALDRLESFIKEL